jgi:hypothetical protein
MTDTIVTIDRRYCGPPGSANGGYACGVVARRLGGPARVRLMSPPPLEQPLSVRANEAEATLLDNQHVVAQGSPATPVDEVPAAVDYDVASNAARNFRLFTGHFFPACFVCGPHRHSPDGLCIFPGRVPDRDIVAAPWTPDPSVCGADRQVGVEVMWAVLDCPSWFGIMEFEPGTSRAMLGQLTARVLRRPAAGESCVVTGWSRGREGRKLYGGAALYSSEGELLGNSEAVWIEPK